MKKYYLFLIAPFLAFACNNDDNANKTEPEVEVEQISFTGRTAGCSTFHIDKLKSNTEQNIALTISGNREALNLNTEATTIALPNNALNVEISEWSLDVNDFFCNDVFPDVVPEKSESWIASSGTILITVLNEEDCTLGDCPYTLQLSLENVIFIHSENNDQKIINNLLIEEVAVGWLPG